MEPHETQTGSVDRSAADAFGNVARASEEPTRGSIRPIHTDLISASNSIACARTPHDCDHDSLKLDHARLGSDYPPVHGSADLGCNQTVRERDHASIGPDNARRTCDRIDLHHDKGHCYTSAPPTP